MSQANDFSMRAILGYFGQLSLLRQNRWLVRITPHTNTLSFFSNNVLGMLARKVSLAPVNLESISYIAGGQSYQNIQGYKPSTISLDLFDTGVEYNALYKYFNAVYNPLTGAYAYPDDIALDISVTEYDQTNKAREWHTYQRCFISSFGGKSYSHEPVESFPTFPVTFLFNGQTGGNY